MDVRAVHKLSLPGRPVVDLHPGVEFLRVRAFNGMPFAVAEPVAAAVARETAERQRAILQLEVHPAGGQVLKDPRHDPLSPDCAEPAGLAAHGRATTVRHYRFRDAE